MRRQHVTSRQRVPSRHVTSRLPRQLVKSHQVMSRNVSVSRHVTSCQHVPPPPRLYTQCHLALAVACSQQMPTLFEFSDKGSQSNAKLGSGDQLSHTALYRHMFFWITNYILYLSTVPATARAILLVKYHSIHQIPYYW